jgi:hypothetical protein
LIIVNCFLLNKIGLKGRSVYYERPEFVLSVTIRVRVAHCNSVLTLILYSAITRKLILCRTVVIRSTSDAGVVVFTIVLLVNDHMRDRYIVHFFYYQLCLL